MPEPLPPSASPSETSKQDLPSGCLLRLGWMAFGNAAMLAFAIVIYEHRGSFLSWADAVFVAVVAATLGLRYADVRHFNGRTASGAPATMAHWRRYAVILVAAAVVLWALAHALAYS
jgi:hypothetical protein